MKKQKAEKSHQLVMIKRVAKADEADPEYAQFLEIRDDKDAKVANFEIALQNVGKADFTGDIVVYDMLPEGMTFASLQAVGIKRANAVKNTMAYIPIYGWIAAAFMSDEKFEPFPDDKVRFSQNGQLITLTLTDVTIPEGKRAAFEFNVGL